MAAVCCHLLMHPQWLLNLTDNERRGNGEGCRPWAALQNAVRQSSFFFLFLCTNRTIWAQIPFEIILCTVYNQLGMKTPRVRVSVGACEQEASWRPLCLVRTLPENLSPPVFLSSTSPGRRRTRRGGSGRSPLVQPSERSQMLIYDKFNISQS